MQKQMKSRYIIDEKESRVKIYRYSKTWEKKMETQRSYEKCLTKS